MNKKEVQQTAEFKRQATKSIMAIALFIFVYLIILTLAVILTGLCITFGVLLIVTKPLFITIALGIGLSSLGVLILIFLLKFIFKSHRVDRSNLIEITEQQEPALFNMIREIVETVGTTFPKKVYLSSEVNAAVFYDSSFWSMFFPVKKNLLIGLGLTNTITREEFKAILSHEFGHFSQKTMKVGSYVYNVNQVIFNMLFENESYENLVQKWSNVSGYFSVFVTIAGKINEGIQWILRKLYVVVNKSYMGLSREMEFHADEIAASVTGFQPLKTSLLRMALADNSFNNVLDFYNSKIDLNIKSNNIYHDQSAVMHFVAEFNNIPLKNLLPDISLEEQSKFNKSKLVISDQWSSHPTTEQRISRLEKSGFIANITGDTPANSIFSNAEKLQQQITEKIFESVKYEGETQKMTTAEFSEEYKKETLNDSFSKIYNGYYDNKNPLKFDLSMVDAYEQTCLSELFSDTHVDLVYSAIALENDIHTLQNIANKTLNIKTFDYDGMRYKRKNSVMLIEKLKPELENLKESIKANDKKIFEFFKNEEKQQNRQERLTQIYSAFFQYDEDFDSKFELRNKLLKDLEFVAETTPFNDIKANFKRIKPIEQQLKNEMKPLLNDPLLQSEITHETKEKLEEYLSTTLEYFGVTSYYDENLSTLYFAINNFSYLLSRKYFLMKKELLDYQGELTKAEQVA